MLIYWVPLLLVVVWRGYRARCERKETWGGAGLHTREAPVRAGRRSRWPLAVAAVPGVFSVVVLLVAVAGPHTGT